MFHKSVFHLITACSFGTILEWYDFTLYAYMTPIMSAIFFPHQDPAISILLTYSVFAIGFLVRPFGSILCGHFGDRIGRKKVLLISILTMAFSTCLIGFLPSWNKIGIAAPIFLTILRILQGIAISGETNGAATLVIESVSHKRGFTTSLVWASSGIGMLLSSFVITILTTKFSHTQILDWAWRIPFFIGALTGIFIFYFRKNTLESTVFSEAKFNNKLNRFPMMTALLYFKKPMLIAIGLYLLCAINIYLIFVFMPSYVSKYIKIPMNIAMTVNTFTMACFVLFVPLFGYFSDHFGRKKILLASAVGFLLCCIPAYWLIANGGISGLVTAQLIFAVLASALNGAVTSAVMEMFPTNIRYSATAVSYNLSYSLFGGTAPIIAVYLINALQSLLAPSLYFIFGAALVIICTTKMQETAKAKLI